MTAMFMYSSSKGICNTLLPKKDNNLLECDSYRPISLLNSKDKILAKVLASRLERVLPSLISGDQSGFVKDRHSFVWYLPNI